MGGCPRTGRQLREVIAMPWLLLIIILILIILWILSQL
jgi:hypothetical protein